MYFNCWKGIKTTWLYTSKRSKMQMKWKPNSKKTSPTDRALHHYDEFYGSVFGDRWKAMRKALLLKQQYVALVNNYGDTEKTVELLKTLGAYDLKDLLEIQRKFNENCNITVKKNYNDDEGDTAVESYASEASIADISKLYGGKEAPAALDLGNVTMGKINEADKPVDRKSYEKLSLSASMKEAEMDYSRIIDPKQGMASGALFTFVPSNKILGNEEWLPESHYYSYYKTGKDFPLIIEEEELEFPEHLKVYSFVIDNKKSFPGPKRGTSGLSNYFLMDGASILPVIALGLKPEDHVLDLCAAPGGKTLACLQTMLPGMVIANDSVLSRTKRIYRLLEEFLYDYSTSDRWDNTVLVSNYDGETYCNDNGFDKILIDVPCTTDRHSVRDDENNIFNPMRLKERLQIAEKQSNLLYNALKLCRVGGSVVYSTCSFSPIQNDGVVHMTLKRAWEEKGISGVIKMHSKFMLLAQALFRFGMGKAAPKYGQLVVPEVDYNFGPMYFCKITRVK